MYRAITIVKNRFLNTLTYSIPLYVFSSAHHNTITAKHHTHSSLRHLQFTRRYLTQSLQVQVSHNRQRHLPAYPQLSKSLPVDLEIPVNSRAECKPFLFYRKQMYIPICFKQKTCCLHSCVLSRAYHLN